MRAPRVVRTEALDQLAADDPAAVGARRDLRRIHRVMRTRAVLRRALRALAARAAPATREAPLRVLELGAGDGMLLLGVARDLAGMLPPVHLCLLDRRNCVAARTIEAYGAAGWRASCREADALDWAGHDPSGAPLERWDLVVASLFLHHFEDASLELILRAAAARTQCFLACEPRRSWPALFASHLVFVLGANAVTRSDAVLSVRAGFRGREISRLWPPPLGRWELQEGRAGVFGHGFCARAGVSG